MKSLLLLVILIVMSGAEAGEIHTLSRTITMYSGADLDRYLSMKGLLISTEAKTACPNGIGRLTQAMVSVNGTFELNGLHSSASTYPIIVQTATVECK